MLKNKKIILYAGIIVLILLAFAVTTGYQAAKVELGSQKVKFDELTEILAGVESKIADEESKLNSMKEEVEKATALIENRDNAKEELSTLESDISEKKTELDSITSDVDSKKKELDTLNGKILEASGKPIELSSGQWFVGTDIPPGRYKASGSSNFVVYSDSGDLMVNTILGYDHGDGDYVFIAGDGYIIDSSAPTTLTPVE